MNRVVSFDAMRFVIAALLCYLCRLKLPYADSTSNDITNNRRR